MSQDQFHDDFAEAMSYGDYLRLDMLLGCQAPRSSRHDEMLFIVVHQATELWMKALLYELRAAVAHVRTDNLAPSFKMLARVARIQAQLIQSWDALSTLTPADYLTFRDALGQASGLQSFQYREMEFLFGAKDAAMLRPHRHDAALHAHLERVLAAPSLYDEALRLLARRGFDLPDELIARDWRVAHRASNPAALEAWTAVYSDTKTYWDLYELAEKLVDLADRFQQWRFRHLTTVARIIGAKTGTGGTSGLSYLKAALERPFFPELWDLRTRL